MPRPKKQPPTNLAHGKDQIAAKEFPKTLEQIFGTRRFDIYHTSNEEEYETALKKMTLIDIQRECIQAELVPNDRRDIMTQRLLKEFRKRHSLSEPVDRSLKTDGKITPAVQAVLDKMLIGNK